MGRAHVTNAVRRTRTVHMKRDTAIRLASTLHPKVSPDELAGMLEEVIAQLATCLACSGTGEFAIHVPEDAMQNDLKQYQKEGHRGAWVSAWVAAGDIVACVGCGGTGLDPEHVRYICFQGKNRKTCLSELQNEPADSGSEHARCGYKPMFEPSEALTPKDVYRQLDSQS